MVAISNPADGAFRRSTATGKVPTESRKTESKYFLKRSESGFFAVDHPLLGKESLISFIKKSVAIVAKPIIKAHKKTVLKPSGISRSIKNAISGPRIPPKVSIA